MVENAKKERAGQVKQDPYCGERRNKPSPSRQRRKSLLAVDAGHDP
jgi:hypothetical protein